MNVPETRYAKTVDGVHIAYQVLGEGPVDFVYVGPWVTHLEYRWELPEYASYLRRIASFSRLIMFDKRGVGMSDPVPADQLPGLETRMDDLRAVMDEVGSERAVIYGASESGALTLLFAATYPERTLALVITVPSRQARRSPMPPGVGPPTSSPPISKRSNDRGAPKAISDVSSLRSRTMSLSSDGSPCTRVEVPARVRPLPTGAWNTRPTFAMSSPRSTCPP